MVFHFCNTFLNLPNILSLFSGKIIISSTRSYLSILSSFDFVTTSAILFPKYSPALWTTFLEACNSVFNNCFLYFLANDKNPYRLKSFLVLVHFYLLVSNVKLTSSFVSHNMPFLFLNFIIISSNCVS